MFKIAEILSSSKISIKINLKINFGTQFFAHQELHIIISYTHVILLI